MAHTREAAGKEAALVVVGCFLTLIATSAVGVQIFALHSYAAGLYTNRLYLLLDLLYFLCGLVCIVCAFLLARDNTSRLRRAFSQCLLIIASLPVLISVADVYVILFRFDSSGPGGVACLTHRNWVETFLMPHQNQFGYWERDISPYLDDRERDDHVVIAALGDSFTLGQGVLGERYRFTDLLQSQLRAAVSRPIDVLNFGKGGADTTLETKMLADVARVHPDIVLIGYLSNDIDAYVDQPSYKVQMSAFERTLIFGSPLYNFLFWRLRAPAAYRDFGTEYFDAIFHAFQDPMVMDRHLADIEALIVRVRSLGAKPVFAILPFPSMWRDQSFVRPNVSPAFVHDLRNSVYASVASKVRALKTPLIEAEVVEDEMTSQAFSINPMDAHPSNEAHRRIAEILSREFVRQELFDELVPIRK